MLSRIPFVILACVLLTPACLDGEEPSRPNVLIILADDMGFSDAGCYGGEIQTPNLDSIAANGLRFTQFYNTSRCWPSRAAILTGYYAQQVRRDTVPGIVSGAQGTRPGWARLLPEMLKPLGYRNYHSGKWHVDGKPLENGFDRSYSLNDHDRHFAPKNHTSDDQPLPPVDASTGYYSSTAIADHAIKCLKEHAGKYSQQPFFEFLAFTAPHFPLQAPAGDIARYRKTYLEGWDVMRVNRWKKLQNLKISGTSLSAIEREVGPPYAIPDAMKKLGPFEVNRPLPWNELTTDQRVFQANKMAVHAAMVDRMDREIGRVLEQLKAMKCLDNTLILFLSDNGASAEIMVRGDGHDPHAECGTGATFLSIGPGWSSLANTPFRRHKTWVHEGGISTPFIVHWPQGFAGRGELRHTPAHIVDVVPTILAAVGSKPLSAIPGKSLLPLFAKDGTVAHESIWWLHEGNRALRVGNWKIVAAGKDAAWELYDLSTDRSEAKNLAIEMPDKVAEMAARWDQQWTAYIADAMPGSKPNQQK
ncbi:MAG TPA: arylsulfatase [Gemmatales bacterium]|nr:arylsulfatase [Gemmatales bacterium]